MVASTVSRRLFILVGVAALFLGIARLAAGPARAALGNSGVPARCYVPGPAIPGGESRFMNCQAADGTPFAGGQRVPTGYYLMVTDVLITPDGGTATAGITDVRLYDAYAESGRRSSIRFRSTTTGSYGRSFTAPNLVLRAGDRLELTTAGFNAHWVEVEVSGVLVTNTNYLPLVGRNP